MKLEQWNRLKRGDRIRSTAWGPPAYTVLEKRNGAILITETTFALKPADWLQLNDEGFPVDEKGLIIEQDCRMCDGAGVAHHNGAMQICPRCAGRRTEPPNLKEEIIEMRVWFPPNEQFPEVIFSTTTELHHGQLIELLTQALNILKATSVEEFRAGGGQGMVS